MLNGLNTTAINSDASPYGCWQKVKTTARNYLPVFLGGKEVKDASLSPEQQEIIELKRKLMNTGYWEAAGIMVQSGCAAIFTGGIAVGWPVYITATGLANFFVMRHVNSDILVPILQDQRTELRKRIHELEAKIEEQSYVTAPNSRAASPMPQ